MLTKNNLLVIAILLFGVILLLWFNKFERLTYLYFSDAAKFADVARNVVNGNGFSATFTFFDPKVVSARQPPFAFWLPPLAPLSIAVLFSIFGIGDVSVIAFSSMFYILLIIVVYLLGKKLFGTLVGFLSALVVAADPNFLEYALSGASEPLFTFEIILGVYLIIARKKWTDVLGVTTLIAMYFTRPQAFIYIAGLIFLWLVLRFPIKKSLLYFLGVVIMGLLTDRLILIPLAGKFFLYPISAGASFVLGYVPGSSSSDLLRGDFQTFSALPIFKKVFYNLYNFYKLVPQWMSPYMWALFVLGLIKWGKSRVENSFKLGTIVMVFLTLLVTSLSIPLFRYLHPVLPLVYLTGVATLVWIVEQIFRNKKAVATVSGILICLFVIGQTLGVIFLDTRFKSKTVNKDKPPIYVQLSHILHDNTDDEALVITNLDTWGSWYGGRKTVWYPLKPNQLEGLEDKVDAIYLTNYLIDDENYYMGPEWRQVFLNPKNIQDKFLAENFRFAGEFKVSADETYEKQEGRAVLLLRK